MKYYIFGLGGIIKDDVINDYVVTGFPSKMKAVITRNINTIIDEYKPKKIKSGKTGDIDDRRKAYKGYNKIFSLYISTNENNVEILEVYYNDYLINNHPNICCNINRGSASVMTNKNEKYILYLALK